MSRLAGQTKRPGKHRAQAVGFESLTPVSLLHELASRQINEVLVEAGPRLAGAWMSAGVVDRLVVFQAPLLMGSQTRPLIETPHWSQLEHAQRLELLNARAFGKDMCLEYALVAAPTEQQ